MNDLLVVVVEEAAALRRELEGDKSYGFHEDVRAYLQGKLHALESVERYLRRQERRQG